MGCDVRIRVETSCRACVGVHDHVHDRDHVLQSHLLVSCGGVHARDGHGVLLQNPLGRGHVRGDHGAHPRNLLDRGHARGGRVHVRSLLLRVGDPRLPSSYQQLRASFPRLLDACGGRGDHGDRGGHLQSLLGHVHVRGVRVGEDLRNEPVECKTKLIRREKYSQSDHVRVRDHVQYHGHDLVVEQRKR